MPQLAWPLQHEGHRWPRTTFSALGPPAAVMGAGQAGQLGSLAPTMVWPVGAMLCARGQEFCSTECHKPGSCFTHWLCAQCLGAWACFRPITEQSHRSLVLGYIMQLKGVCGLNRFPPSVLTAVSLGPGGCKEASWSAWPVYNSDVSPGAAFLKGLLAVTSHSHFHPPFSLLLAHCDPLPLALELGLPAPWASPQSLDTRWRWR